MKRQAAFVSTPTWDPGPSARARVDHLIERYRKSVTTHLAPLVRTYNPAMLTDAQDEYRKMLELSAKMNVVGHACTEIFGHDYDERRQSIGSLFGACCFLADSFIDDFGERVTREYLERLEVLLTDGWFDLRTDRERLFFVILSRLFVERDLLHPTVRQAILQLYDALAARRAFRDNGPMSLPRAIRRTLARSVVVRRTHLWAAPLPSGPRRARDRQPLSDFERPAARAGADNGADPRELVAGVPAEHLRRRTAQGLERIDIGPAREPGEDDE
jgi:hypothetical protein